MDGSTPKGRRRSADSRQARARAGRGLLLDGGGAFAAVAGLLLVFAATGCRKGAHPGAEAASVASASTPPPSQQSAPVEPSSREPAVAEPSQPAPASGVSGDPVPSPGVPEPTLRAEATIPNAPGVRGSRQFYGVYVSGHKAGWAEQRVEGRESGGVRLAMHVEVRVARTGAETRIVIDHDVDYAALPDGRIEAFALRQMLPGGARSSVEGKLVGDAFEVDVVADGSRNHKTVPRPRETARDTIPSLLAPRLGNPGDAAIEVWQFDPQTLRDIPVETRVVSRESRMVGGRTVQVLEVLGVDRIRGIRSVSRFTPDGLTLEMKLGAGFELVLEDEAVARNPNVAVPDLYRLSLVPADRGLGDASSVRKLRVRLAGLPDGLRVSDARQSRDGEELTVRRLIWAELPKSTLSEDDRQRWLEATAFLDHQTPEVKRLAAQAGEGGALERARRLNAVVHRALRYSLETAPLSASAILRSQAGDCTEYARVMVAAARAAGIPAREVSGLAWAGDAEKGFAFHAWAELWIGGRWFALDPTWGQVPVDGTHIAVARDDPAPIVGMLGGTRATILEVVR